MSEIVISLADKKVLVGTSTRNNSNLLRKSSDFYLSNTTVCVHIEMKPL